MTIDRDELRRHIQMRKRQEDRTFMAMGSGHATTADADLRVWERHRPEQASAFYCLYDENVWPCPDFVDLAARYGMTP